MKDARREDDPRGLHHPPRAIERAHLDTPDAVAVQHHAGHRRVGHDREVRAVPGGIQVGDRGGLAPSILEVVWRGAHAVRLGDVGVVAERQAHILGGADERFDRGVGRVVEVISAVELQRPGRTVEWTVAEIGIGLDGAHRWQQGVVRPVAPAVMRPGLEVAGHRTHDRQVVHRRTPAHDPAGQNRER